MEVWYTKSDRKDVIPMATEQEKNRRVAEQLRLIDDDFLRLYFNDNPEGVEYILNILLERQDLKVLHSETQCEYRSLSGRSISLDIYAEDTNGKKIQHRNSKSGFRSNTKAC